jgi:hypothetical protein
MNIFGLGTWIKIIRGDNIYTNPPFLIQIKDFK